MKTVYPCQYPDCHARYDETLDGKVMEGTYPHDVEASQAGILTGWTYPAGTAQAPVMHEHILNVMHHREVDDNE